MDEIRRITQFRVFQVWALLCLVIVPILPGASLPARLGAVKATARKELTISAAISLKDALDEIIRLYRTQAPEVTIHTNYGASGTLQRQLEEGAPVDIFVSASADQMNALETEGLILAGTRFNMARNSVVLIATKGMHEISGFSDLTRPGVKTIAIGEPQTVPAGKYAKEVLSHFGIYNSLKAKLVLAKDVRQVLTYVATGNADAGIVYATDAKSSSQVVVVATAPVDSHNPVVYPAGIMKASKDAAAAKAFLEYLQGTKACAVFEEFGFASGE